MRPAEAVSNVGSIADDDPKDEAVEDPWRRPRDPGLKVFHDGDHLRAVLSDVVAAGVSNPRIRRGLAARNIVVGFDVAAPDAQLALVLREPPGVGDPVATTDAAVTLRMTGEVFDRFWRGDYNLGIGVGRGKVVAEGDINTLVAALPALRPLFPFYRRLTQRRWQASP